ncbi:MAG: hypothetical protein WC517_04365 [Patescibacteria group bacterium]
MVKKKMASASMQALDSKIQKYKDILGIHKKAEVTSAEPIINPSQEVGNNVASTVDKLVDRIEAAINEVKELGDKPDSTEKAEEQVQAASASTEQEVKKESSETWETTVKDTSKTEESSPSKKEEESSEKEAVLKIRRIVAHSTKLAKLQIAQKLADARNFEKTAGVNPTALATLAAILGVGGGVYAGTRNPNMISDIKNRFGGGAQPAPAPVAPAQTPRTVTLPMPNKEPVRIPANPETPDKFSQDAIKEYDAMYDPQSRDRLFDFETDPRAFKGSDVYGGIPTSEIKDLEAVDAANQKNRESGLNGGLTEQEIMEYLQNEAEHQGRQNDVSAARDFLNSEKENFYGPQEAPQDTEEGSLFDAAADPAYAEQGKQYLKEVDPEQETMSRKLESLDDEALGKLARTNPKMLAALLGALGLTGAGAGAYAMTRGEDIKPAVSDTGTETEPAGAGSDDAGSLLGAAMGSKAGEPQRQTPEIPTDMLRELGVEIGANGEQRPIDNFQDPNSGQTLDYDAVSKELEEYIKGQQEGDTGVMPWEK